MVRVGSIWITWLRRVIIFILGILLIINSLSGRFEVIPFVVGLIMIGLIPIDLIIDTISRPSHNEHEIDRLRDVMKEKPLKNEET